jgi:hypothetical protein
MVSKCANPNCSATFHHRQGRLFRFPKQPVEDGRPANTHSVQHFWLCEACFSMYSLEYLEREGVVLRRRFEPAREPGPRKFIGVA